MKNLTRFSVNKFIRGRAFIHVRGRYLFIAEPQGQSEFHVGQSGTAAGYFPRIVFGFLR
jgi:hypothetical protein